MRPRLLWNAPAPPHLRSPRATRPIHNQLTRWCVQKVSVLPEPETPGRQRDPPVSTSDLKTLLDDVPDTLELVLHGARGEAGFSPVVAAWREAHEEAAHALRTWSATPGDRSAYAAYRAAQDREDAAQDALAQTHTPRTSVS
jgi:hypothetical protein